MLLPFLLIFIIVTAYISIRQRNATRAEQDVWKRFRERELDANWTRKQDISNLAYIKLPIEKLPLGKHDDETLLSYETALRDLSALPICNLNGISNTELKLNYGAANLSTLSQCDTNYSTLVTLLANYGETLYSLSYVRDAAEVLEYAVTLGSDIAKNYELLAKIYISEQTPEKLESLISSAEALTSIRRSAILERLHAYQAQNEPATEFAE